MISVEKSALEHALKTASNTVAAGGSDISTHYLFRVRSGALEVLSSNSRTWSSCPVAGAVVGGDCSFTLEAKRVHCLLDSVGGTSPLEFETSGAEVRVKTDRGTNTFSSLDPNLFPTWDDQLAGARVTAKIASNRLYDAFTHARLFVYDQEGKAPHLCVIEFRKGCLYSTDQTAVSIIRVAGMEESSLRVYGKDVGNLLSFLSHAKDTEIELREGERASFFLRSDGAVFGEAIFGHRFPDVAVDWGIQDDQVWGVFREELEGDIKFLSAGARWEDTRLRLRRDGNDVVLTMATTAGKDVSLKLKLNELVEKEGAPAFPEDGFAVSHSYLTQAVSHTEGTVARLGVSVKGKGGWVRVREDRGPDSYLTTIAWMKKV